MASVTVMNIALGSRAALRGAKVQQSSASDVADGVATWGGAASASGSGSGSVSSSSSSKLIFIVTLYKNADGSFEKKEYSVKAQAVEGGAGTGKDPKLATYAKTTIDFSEHARLEHSARDRLAARGVRHFPVRLSPYSTLLLRSGNQLLPSV